MSRSVYMPLSLVTLKIVVRFEAKGVCIRSTKFVSQREYGSIRLSSGEYRFEPSVLAT